MVTKLAVEATHPKREVETSLGNLYADAFANVSESDVVLLGSGSVRKSQLGPVVTLKDFISSFPYDDTLIKFYVTGDKIKKMFSHFMRAENRNGEGECYQVNSKVRAVYNNKNAALESLKISGLPVEDTKIYTVCIQGYHHVNCEQYLNITNEELQKEKCSKVVTTSAQDVLEEYLRNNQNLRPVIEDRLVYK
ncbi:5'-nucleotidase [candidate division WWE3 bacterium]|uniref:5'-nucleotidase n=1 Tax=candidate division WWE3 bacterium TaxID=2053526 RepID=A0A7X9DLK5_UNCKA|nr:5'-nucleotidase [candidate division WWE3 bacterium]